MFNDLAEKDFYIQEGLEGASLIINMGSLIYYDKNTNFVYYGTAIKIFLCLRKGQLLQFWVSISCLKNN